jgi:hypothetical protein
MSVVLSRMFDRSRLRLSVCIALVGMCLSLSVSLHSSHGVALCRQYFDLSKTFVVILEATAAARLQSDMR